RVHWALPSVLPTHGVADGNGHCQDRSGTAGGVDWAGGRHGTNRVPSRDPAELAGHRRRRSARVRGGAQRLRGAAPNGQHPVPDARARHLRRGHRERELGVGGQHGDRHARSHRTDPGRDRLRLSANRPVGTRTVTTARWSAWLYHAFIAAVCAFIMAPIVAAVVLSFSSAPQLTLPPPGLSLRWYVKAAATREFIGAIGTSAAIAACVSVLSMVSGTLAAIAVNHHRFRARAAVQTLLMLPLVLPGVVIGLAMLQTLSLYGLRPGLLAAVLGHTVIGTPYVSYLVLSALANYDL